MEPFSILCETCAARLKVRNASLVNQVLACPKCQAMVKVLPPEGWVSPPELQASSDAHSQTNNSFDGSDFDDIDSLIKEEQKRPVQKPQPTPASHSSKPPQPTPQTKTPANTQVNQQPAATATAQSNDAPIMPGEAWTSDATRKRQKLTLILASALAGLILLIGIIVAVVATSGGETVAQQEEKSVADLLNEANSKTPESNETDSGSTGTPLETSDPKTESEPESADVSPVANKQTSPDSEPKPNTDTEPTGSGTTSPQPQPLELPGTSPNPQPLVPPFPAEKENQQDRDPLALEFDPNASPDELLGQSDFSNESIASRLGDLNDLLSANGLSLGGINNIAEANRVTELIGVPKYFIKAPDPQPTNLTQNLSNQLAGVQYQEGVSLTDFNRDIGDFLGAPISIHAETFLTAGVPLDPPLDIKSTELSFQQAIESAISPLGLTFVQTERGLVLVAKGWNTPIERRFQPSHLNDNSPQGQAAFVRQVRGMFAEEAWKNASIKMEGDELIVTQVPQVHFQIQRLLDKLNACQQLKTAPDDKAALEMLQTEWSRAQKVLKTETTLEPSIALNMNSFLRKIESKVDARILVDWNSVSGRGWYPNTSIPGDFNEKNLEATLRELSRSLGVTYRALDAKTFEILTFEEASLRPELQVYSAANIITEEFRSEDLLETLRVTLPVDSSLIQVRMNLDTQGLIVIAPQSIQRQFEAVITQLRPKQK